jgi:hypothetical protein
MNFVECPETCGHYWSENLVWKGLALWIFQYALTLSAASLLLFLT